MFDLEELLYKEIGFRYFIYYEDIEDYQLFISELNEIEFLDYEEHYDYILIKRV